MYFLTSNGKTIHRSLRRTFVRMNDDGAFSYLIVGQGTNVYLDIKVMVREGHEPWKWETG